MGPRTLRSIAGFAIGLILIGVAVLVLLRNEEDLRTAIDEARKAPVWLVALALLLPTLNAFFVAVSFWVLMRRFGRVPFGDMVALIASAWLLNYLPLRPGLVGRLAFHKFVHGVHLRSSVAVSVALAIMSALAAAHLLAVGAAVATNIWLGLGTILVTTGAVWWLSGFAADRSPAGAVPRGALRHALLYRYVDMLVWALRMWVCFRIVGADLTPTAALLIASAVQVALLFPLTGGGLGVVEWAVGVVAGIVAVSASAETGLAASLVNRAAEVLIVIPVGLFGTAYVAKRRHRASESRHKPISRQFDASEG